MKGTILCALLCLAASVALHAQQPWRMGRIAERLSAQDVQRIAGLTSNSKDVVWSLEGMSSPVSYTHLTLPTILRV